MLVVRTDGNGYINLYPFIPLVKKNNLLRKGKKSTLSTRAVQKKILYKKV